MTWEACQTSTHTQVKVGGVVFTAVTRNRLVSRVEPYSFRKSLAQSAQLNLPGIEAKNQSSGGNDELFALLVYGGSHNRPDAQFGRVYFPKADGRFLPGFVDILSECKNLTEELRGTTRRPTEQVPQSVPRPTPKRKPTSEEGGNE